MKIVIDHYFHIFLMLVFHQYVLQEDFSAVAAPHWGVSAVRMLLSDE